MLDWIKLGNKNYPEFWKKYLSTFDQKSSRIVILTIDTSGTDAKKDVILSIAAIAVYKNSLSVGDSFEAIISHQKTSSTDEEKNQYLEESLKEKMTEQVAIENLLLYLKNSTIVGHRVDFDEEFINESLIKLGCGKLKNEALDLEIMYRKWKDFSDNKSFNINDLQYEFKIEKSDRNDTIEDAFALGLIYLKLKSRLGL